MSFNDKVVLVTGSSSGIGAGIAIEFAKQGAQLTITGRNVDGLKAIANEVKAASGKEPLQLIGDISSTDFQKKLINETVTKFGRLDVLVNNAGWISTPDDISNPNIIADFDRIHAINVRAPLYLTHLAMDHLEKTNGNIVNISSVASMIPMMPIYCSSKAALDMITKTTALQLAKKGIRVNSVNPGPVSTNIMRGVGVTSPEANKAMFEKHGNFVPLKFTAVPKDIANSVLFLANNELARNITGTILANDSGMLIEPGCMSGAVQELEGLYKQLAQQK